jgi:hypothetical protein
MPDHSTTVFPATVEIVGVIAQNVVARIPVGTGPFDSPDYVPIVSSSVPETSTFAWRLPMRWKDNTLIQLADIDTAVMTLYEGETGAILNGRNQQNIKNTNDVSINDTDGMLTWRVQAADTTMQNIYRSLERHVALFMIVGTQGETWMQEVHFPILNMRTLNDSPEDT